jgi:hypothetical protein
MAIIVGDEVLKRTTKCPKAFRCLSEELLDSCLVLNSIGNGVIITLCAIEESCPYCKPINNIEGFCKCPTRIELYNRHEI